MCVPMIALCLLTGCGGEAPEVSLRDDYLTMTGCRMEAEVTCGGETETVFTLRCDYVPEGDTTVEVLAPETAAGVKAILRGEDLTLEYEDVCLPAGTLSAQEISPAACLPRLMSALREGWLLEQNDESREGIPCTRLALDQTGASDTDIVTTVWLRQADGTPFLGEIAVDGETILTVRFTAFGFCDTIADNS